MWTYIWCILAILYVCYIIYHILTTGVYKGTERLDGKHVIVTGANSGIGFVCAKEFARRGAKVIMLCRDMVTAERARIEIIKSTRNDKIKLKHIDFSSLMSVRKCAQEILKEEARIDILLNNAGASGIGIRQTDDGLDELMQVNYFGPFLLTNLLLGLIKRTSPSRIVNVSSDAHTMGRLNPDNLTKSDTTFQLYLYSNSKLGNIYFTNELARLLKGTGVTANSLHPGVFNSNITRHGSHLFQVIWKSIVQILGKSVEEGAQTSLYLCLSPDVANVTGKYFADCRMIEPSKVAQDMNMAKTLWELTEEAVKLKPTEKYY
ncbi:retinol dehydrogenase 14-like [Arctopsyche grandis]|uniref:retinol dehydrogenase 14-like n=1 Tax=Arctopsyche grandis TaxID=121162 RepID=UPI00406D7BA1